MRKKWTYVAIVSMMLGVAPVFTGCVDTDEPAGITELRGAKAELLRAKAAVEQARVALVQAKADLKAAEAESERANAEWINQLAREQEIKNDFEQAKNDIELQKLQAQLDSIQTSLAYWKEEAAVRHEKKMAKLNEAAAKAQYAYEVALKQIEVAKALGVAYNEVSLTALETAVEEAYKELFGDPDVDGDYGLAEELRNKNEELYNAQLNKDAGIVADEDGSNPQFVAKLEAKIAVEEARLAGKEQELADLEEVAKLDIEGTDWAAEINTLKEEAAQLEVQLQEKQAEKKRLQAEPDYLAKYQAVHGVYSEYEENDPTQQTASATLVKNGTEQNLSEANTALVNASNDSKYTFSIDKFESTTEVTQIMSDAVTGGLPLGKITINGADKFVWGNSGDATAVPAAAQSVLSVYENYLNQLKNVVWQDANDIAQAQAVLKEKQEAEEAAKKNYEDAYEAWETVKDIIANGTDYQVDITAFKKTTDAYNTAYTALNTAITNYNNGLEAAYDEAYDENYDKEVLALRVDVLAGTGNAATAKTQIDAIQGFGAAGASAVITAYNAGLNKTEEYLNTLILNNCTPYTSGTTAVTAAQIQAQVLEVINAYVRQETNALAWADTEEQIEGLAKAAADTWANSNEAGKGQKLMEDVIKANNDLADAYDDVLEGWTDFNDRAATFSQVTGKNLNDATKVEEYYVNYLMGAIVNDKVTALNPSWYDAGTGDNVLGTTAAKLIINNSNITDAELTAATKTTYDSTKKQTALDAVSQEAFGVDNRYAAVDLEECQGTSKGALYQAAIDAREEQEAIISANDDLKALQTEIQTAYNAAKADLTAQYNEVFAAELKAIADATTAHKAAEAALAEADKQFKELDVEIGQLSAQVSGKNSVASTLEGYVNAYLKDNGADFKYDPDTFEAKIAETIAQKREEVAGAEELLAKAEIELKKAQDGKYDEVDYLTWELSIIQERYDAAMERYTKAQEDLAKYMEIMAGSDATEQPAE